MQWQRQASFLLCLIILFIFAVAILKIIYNMTSSKINLTLKVIGRMIFLPGSTLFFIYKNEKQFNTSFELVLSSFYRIQPCFRCTKLEIAI